MNNWNHAINLRAISRRVRGNPAVLALMLVACICGAIGFIIISKGQQNPSCTALGGAFIGSGISSLATLAINFLSQPRLRSVPMGFLEAVRRDVSDADYYRTNQQFRLTIDENERSVLQFHFQSTIIPKAGQETTVKGPEISAPPGLSSCEASISYTVNNRDPGKGGVTISSPSSEVCTIKYKIRDDAWKELKDEHKCVASVENFIVSGDLPSEFEMQVHAMNSRGLELLDYDPTVPPSRRVFTYRQSLFAGQGFTWRITRSKIRRN